MFSISEERIFLNRTLKDLNALLSVVGKPLCRVNFDVADDSSMNIVMDLARIFMDSWNVLVGVLRLEWAPSHETLAIGTSVSPITLTLFRAGVAQKIIRAFIDSIMGAEANPLRMTPVEIAWHSGRVRYLGFLFACSQFSLHLRPHLIVAR